MILLLTAIWNEMIVCASIQGSQLTLAERDYTNNNFFFHFFFHAKMFIVWEHFFRVSYIPLLSVGKERENENECEFLGQLIKFMEVFIAHRELFWWHTIFTLISLWTFRLMNDIEEDYAAASGRPQLTTTHMRVLNAENLLKINCTFVGVFT